MWLKLLKAKIHDATVTETDLRYSGSITVDRELMDAVGLVPNEMVLVANRTNGQRLTTYVIPGEPGSGAIGINGAAARLVSKGDKVLIIASVYLEPAQAKDHKATVIVLDESNRIKQTIRH